MPKRAPNYVVFIDLKFGDKVADETRRSMRKAAANHCAGTHPVEEHTFSLAPVDGRALQFTTNSWLAGRFIHAGVNSLAAKLYMLFAVEFNDVAPEDVSIRYMVLETVASTGDVADFLRQSE
jgi:hypothetical protein